jgi:hypothetical protein
MLRMGRGLAAGLTAVVLAAGCGGGGAATKTVTDVAAGFTFAYPANFTRGFAGVGREIQGRSPLFSVNVGLDPTNLIVLETYRLRRAYETYTPAEFEPIVTSAVLAIGRAVNERVTAIGHSRLGPLVGYDYALVALDGTTMSRILLGFRGSSEWYLRCQWTTTGTKTIPAACDQVARTFAPKP